MDDGVEHERSYPSGTRAKLSFHKEDGSQVEGSCLSQSAGRGLCGKGVVHS